MVHTTELPALPFVQAAVLGLAEKLARYDLITTRCELQALEWSLRCRGHDTAWLEPQLRELEQVGAA